MVSQRLAVVCGRLPMGYWSVTTPRNVSVLLLLQQELFFVALLLLVLAILCCSISLPFFFYVPRPSLFFLASLPAFLLYLVISFVNVFFSEIDSDRGLQHTVIILAVANSSVG